MVQCIGYLNREHVLQTRRILRESGNEREIHRLLAEFRRGKNVVHACKTRYFNSMTSSHQTLEIANTSAVWNTVLIMAGDEVNLLGVQDCHTVAGLLKLHFRLLQPRLLSRDTLNSMYEHSCSGNVSCNRKWNEKCVLWNYKCFNYWRASETLSGVTQFRGCLFVCIYVWTYVCHFVLWPSRIFVLAQC